MDKMMSTNERQKLDPPLSLLQRLIRLDRLLLILEGKQCLSARHSAAAVDKCVNSEDQCKSLSSALEEVDHKGSLMERVAMLENRVIQLQLSLDMGTGNTSRSSSSTTAAADEQGHGSGSPEARGPNKDMNMITAPHEKQDRVMIQDSIVAEACSLNSPSCRGPRRRRKISRSRVRYNRKWLKWLQLGC